VKTDARARLTPRLQVRLGVDAQRVAHEGRALLAVDITTLAEPEIAALLPDLFAAGVEEITRADYFAALPSAPE